MAAVLCGGGLVQAALKARGGEERFHWTTHPWLITQMYANATGNVSQAQLDALTAAIEEVCGPASSPGESCVCLRSETPWSCVFWTFVCLRSEPPRPNRPV